MNQELVVRIAKTFDFKGELISDYDTLYEGHPVHEVAQGAKDPREVEELALTIGAVVVINRHLGKTEASILKLLYQLQTDCATI